MSEEATRPKLVLIGGRPYMLNVFEAAFNQAALDHLATRTENKKTPRAVMRAVAAMKSPKAHRIVLKDALERVTKLDPVLVPGDIAARFPAPDKV